MTDAEKEVWARHFTRLAGLLADGLLITAGPTLGPINTGVTVFEAPDQETGQRIVDEDPAVASGIATGELRPFHLSLSR